MCLNHFETILSTPAHEKIVFMKLAPGAKNVGDHYNLQI